MPKKEPDRALTVEADEASRHTAPASGGRGAEEHLAEAQQIAQLGSWEWNPDAPEMSWSDELYRIFGYEPASFPATLDAFLGCIHPEDRLDVESRFAAALSTPSCLDFQYRIVRPDGGIRSLNCRAEVVAADSDSDPEVGGAVRIIGTAHDVTELRLFAGSLASQVEQFQQLTQASVAIYAADGIEEILEVATGQAMRIIGAEIARGHIADGEGSGEVQVHLCRDPDVREESAKVLAALGPVEGPVRVAAGATGDRHAGLGEDERRWVRRGWLAVPLVDLVGGASGAIQLLDKQLDDFTDGDEAILTQIAQITSLALQKAKLFEKLLESQEKLHQAQKMEAVGQLAGGIAHDFNNMLMAIQGFANLLDEEVAPSGRAHIAEIRKAADRSARLTRQLLAYGRRQVLQPEVLQLNDAIGGMGDRLRRVAGAKVELVTALDPRLGHAFVDPGQLEQVLMNLVQNACEAMADGGRLTVRTRNHENRRETDFGEFRLPPGRYIALTVADTGRGIPADVLPRIYEPFFTTKPVGSGSGSGLGLATVYGIVKQSGGFIHARSRPGEGTSFTLYLPRHDAVPAVAQEPTTPTPDAGGEPPTVLIAEDEPVLRSLAGIVLRRDGYRVLEAEDGLDALRIARDHDFAIDLLVTDLVMPRLGGHRLAHQLLQHRPGLKIVFMSGYAEEAVAGEGLLGEGATFLAKPFSPKVLAGTVREKLAVTVSEVASAPTPSS